METAPCEANNGLLFANFNQDFGCFVSCTGRGFRIFNSDPLREREARLFCPPPEAKADDDPAVSADATLEAVGMGKAKIVKAEMLFRCNYVALVVAPSVTLTSSATAAAATSTGQQQGHKVVIWDDLKQMGVIQLEFNAEVRSVRLRRDRIVVVLKSLIKVYTFTAAPQQLHVFDTAPNWKGLCSLSPSSNNSMLAFPTAEAAAGSLGSAGTGDGEVKAAIDPSKVSASGGNVKLIDLAKPNNPPLIIAAHTSSLCCLTLNIQGTRLATASDKGTLIRIFDTATGNIINELRRGSQSATIYSINFSPDSSLVVASSSHGTIHVFSAEDSSRNKHSSLVSTATSMMGNLFGSSGSSSAPSAGSSSSSAASPSVSGSAAVSQMPKFVPKYFTSEWSFSRIEVPGGTRCIVAFSPVTSTGGGGGGGGSQSSAKTNEFAILAVCSDGSYYKFVFDEKKDGFIRDVYQMFVENDASK